ncbi:MAG: hypothetical protein PF450_03685 [Bacteroidales bacterium]|jgi:hypothetical protein|nr:hypothetical protein [Bacteroidales bacterium]
MKEVNSTKLTISRHENGFSISRDGTQQSYFSNIAELKHAFINQIMFATYSVPPEDWFAWIHGSAVAKGQNATIFTSSSGSGKSTMAALMQSRGYRFVSDDMVYLRQSDRLAYPVPTAMSLKEGSVSVVSNYIPSLKTDKLHFYEFGDRKVCFKKPDCEGSETFNPVVVRTLIFIKYKQGTIFSMKKLSDFEAFQRFHKQAWVNGSKESALAFITWFEELSYYELEYSDTDKAIMEIEKLFQENS